MTGLRYAVDQQDPRAPSAELWAAMSPAEREAVVAQLPSEVPRETAPEGDAHFDPKVKALEALREYYRRLGRRVYLAAELPVYYPGERLIAPDLMAVLDVETHQRPSWMVSREGRGLDLALEITLEGDRKKDLETNVVRFARLGIPEYFVLDLKLRRIVGYRLGEPQTYVSIVPQSGRWASRVLGLDLALELGRVRFFAGSAPLPQADELIARLDTMVGELVAKEEALGRELDAATARAEQERARAERLAERLRALGEDPDEP